MMNQALMTHNKIWTKYIPWSNRVFMVLSLALFLLLDLYILFDNPSLLMFWLAMLVVMIIFLIIYRYENVRLKKQFSNSKSKLDPWLLTLVAIRNIVFVLNFIPYIQIIGGVALIFGIVPYLIVYFILIKSRSKGIILASNI